MTTATIRHNRTSASFVEWLITALPQIIAEGLTCDEFPLTANDILIDEPLAVRKSRLDVLVTIETPVCGERERNSAQLEEAIKQALIRGELSPYTVGVWIRFHQGEFFRVQN